mgnify:CR=1 FL=1
MVDISSGIKHVTFILCLTKAGGAMQYRAAKPLVWLDMCMWGLALLCCILNSMVATLPSIIFVWHCIVVEVLGDCIYAL